MKVLIVLSALVACSLGQVILPYTHHGVLGHHGSYVHPYAHGFPYAYGHYPAYHATQYHAQDEFGQASFGYAHPGQAHAAVRDAHGGVAGSYSYINPEGKEVHATYIADALGFRIASNDLPVAPVADLQQPVFDLVGPSPVQDTPEVAAAKAEHLAAVEAATAGSRRKRQVLLAAHYPHHCVGHNCEVATPLALGHHCVGHNCEVATPLALGHHCVGHNCEVATPLALGHHCVGHNCELPLLNLGHHCVGHNCEVATPLTFAHHAAPVHEATLTKIVHNPHHAVSYRVD